VTVKRLLARAGIKRQSSGAHLLRHYLPFPTIPWRIYLNLDATDDRIHGMQEGRHFNGYYDDYCYLPLYIFCGDELLCAKLRTADKGAADGALEEVKRIVKAIRKRWPKTEIVVRGDSGFCQDDLMAWCESQSDVYYVVGMAQNDRLLRAIVPQQEQAQLRCEISGKSARVFTEFRYRTLKSWSCERRVIAKAEHVPGKANPRFVVTSLPKHSATVGMKKSANALILRKHDENCAAGRSSVIAFSFLHSIPGSRGTNIGGFLRFRPHGRIHHRRQIAPHQTQQGGASNRHF
jgi:hypothetical protein